jgi:hypothetical protein
MASILNEGGHPLYSLLPTPKWTNNSIDFVRKQKMQPQRYVPYDIRFGFQWPLVPGDVMQVKVVAFGDDAYEKAAVVERIRWGRYPPPKTTLKYSTEFVSKLVKPRSSSGARPNTKNDAVNDAIQIELWDCCSTRDSAFGEAPGLPRRFGRGASVALFCFSHSPTLRLDDGESVAQHVEDAVRLMRPWLVAVGTQYKELTPLPVVVGLRVDCIQREDQPSSTNFLTFDTQVLARVREMITQHCPDTIIPADGMRVFHVSAKTGEGIDSLLQYIADTMKLVSEQFPVGVSGGPPDRLVLQRPGSVRLPALPVEAAGSAAAKSSSWCWG